MMKHRTHIDHATCCRKATTILLMAVLLLFSIKAEGQEYAFRRYGVNDGLPSQRVNCCLQDSRGFMWFGTDLGLVNYDGNVFRTNFPCKPGPVDLQCTVVSCLLQDDDGLLWIGSMKGLYSYDMAHDRMEHRMPNDWAMTGVRLLSKDADGGIWVVAADAFYRLDFAHSDYRRFEFSKYFYPSGFVTTQSGILWLLSLDGQIYQYVPKTNSFSAYRVVAEDEDDRVKTLIRGLEREDGKIVILTSTGGARLFSPTTKKVETLFTSFGDSYPVIAHNMLKRTENEYWFGTERGIYVWTCNGPNAGFVNLQKNVADSRSLSDNAVHAFCLDKEGGVWVATAFGGANYMASNQSAFSHIALTDAHDRVECNVVRSIVPDGNDALWIGAEDGGVYHYDIPAGQMNSLSYLSWQGKSLPSNVQSLLQVGKMLWIGNFDGKIYVYDPSSERIVQCYALPYSFPVDMLASRDGHVYVATVNELFECVPPVGDSPCVFNCVEGVPSGFMHHLCEDHSGNLWLASIGQGVWCRNATGSGKPGKWQKMDFPDEVMCSVFEDSRGIVWVGSFFNGLYRYDAETQKGVAVENSLHQPGLGIYRIIEDNRGVLWCSSNNGLYSYDRTTENVIRYGLSPIMSTAQFNFNSGYIDGNGKIYLGSLDGILAYSPEQMAQPQVDLAVYFSDYIIEGNSFGVCFSVPVFSIQETLWFRYRLKGVDSDWTVVQGQQNIRYTNLSYGSYTLEVEASLQNGNWTGQTYELQVDILAPWYATTLARCLYVLLFAVVAYVVIQRYRQSRRAKALALAEHQRSEHEKELAQEKMKFFTAITHELRTPLTLILTPVKSLMTSFSAQKAQLMLPTIHRNASELLNLVNQILDYRKLEQGRTKLDLSHGDFNDFCRTVMALFQDMASKKRISFTTNIEESLYFNFDKEKMQRIVMNLLSNAFKFTPENGTIRLETHVVGKQCELIVSDSGIGIAAKDLPHVFDLFYQSDANRDPQLENQVSVGNGIGLHLVKEFVTMHSGQVSVESNNDAQAGKTGTTFTIVLPTDLASNVDKEQDETSPQAVQPLQEPDDMEEIEDKANQKPVILLVDDNEELRQYLQIELCEDYTILQAANGQEALDMAMQNDVDIVVSDVMMPVMDGMELCRKLKDNVKTSHLFVILLTAKVGEQYRLSGYKSGADYYIAKPFNVEILRNRIAHLYKQRQQQHDKFLQDVEVSPSDITNSPLDEELYDKAVQLITKNLDNEAYSVEQFSVDMCMSRMTLYRKIQSFTGQKPLEFIRAIRLKKAASLLLAGTHTINEISTMVGFGTARNFSRNFKQFYGVSPTEYKKNK